MLPAERNALRAAMDGAPLAEALGFLVCMAIQQTESNARCAFYIANGEGTELHHVVGMPDAYARQVDGFKISPESLACGLAVATGGAVITPDVLLEPRWTQWLWLARQFDYRACWSFPLETSTGRVVGTFAMYFREPRGPTPQDLELAATLTDTASIIISRHQEVEERARAVSALRDSEAHLTAILNQVPGAIGLVNREGKFLVRGGPLSVLLSDTMPSSAPEALRPWRGFDANGQPLPPSDYPGPRAFRGETVTPGLDFIYTADDGRERWYRVSAAPFRNTAGEIVGAVGDLQDIDDIKRTEARLRESEARLQAAVDLMNLGRYSLNLQTAEFQWDDTVRAMWGLPPGAPVSYEVWRSGVHPDDLASVEQAIRDRIRQVIREGVGSDGSVVSDFEYRVIGITDRVERWIAARARISFENGKPVALFGVTLDITERKRSEQAYQLLIAELQHRTRNLLAVVNGISTQTLAASGSLADYSATFGNRLAALSRVHGLLSQSDVIPVTVGELVRMELQALGAEPNGQSITVEGPEVTLPNKSVQVLALALHELATNARKHGALAVPGGRLTVTWRTTTNGLERSLVIEWREHCAAADGERAPSQRKGFGRKLIEEALPYQLDAQTRLEFKPEGVFCSVTINLGSQQSGAGR